MVLRYFYQKAPTYIIHKVDDFFDINDQQEQFLQSQLEPLMAWHKKVELQNYIDFLNQMNIRIADGINNADFNFLVKNFFQFRDNIYHKALPTIVAFLATLNNEQIQYCEKKLDKNLQPLIKRAARPHLERLNTRAERTIESLEDWYGSLTPEQENDIIVISRSSPEWLANWIKFRKARHKEIIAFLKTHASEKEIKKEMEDVMFKSKTRATTLRNPQTRKFIAELRSQTVAIDKVMTQKQRQHLIDKLKDFIVKLKYLQH